MNQPCCDDLAAFGVAVLKEWLRGAGPERLEAIYQAMLDRIEGEHWPAA
jgi:hypothetical protein